MAPVTASLLIVGDELLAGDIVDSNATRIAAALRRWGVELVRKVTIRDRLDELVAAFRAASELDICLVSGGLGPTTDDLTAAGLAAAAGVELERDHEVITQLRERFAPLLAHHADRFGPEAAEALIEANLKQADLPAGSERLDNPLGTAPGFALDLVSAQRPDHRCWVACMPGVPQELATMLEQQVRPRLADRFSLTPAPRRVFRVLGDGESSIQNRIEPVTRMLAEQPDLAGVMLHYRAHTPEILLTFEALSDAGGQRATAEALRQLDAPLREILGDELFAISDESLVDLVVPALEQAGLTVATAESCTGGGLGAMITERPGTSAVFHGGVIAYANHVKVSQLGVDPDTLEREGAVSEAVARQMARGVCEALGSDLGVGITGVAGPGGGTPQKPVGRVHVAVYWREAPAGTAERAHDPAQTTSPKSGHRRLRLRGKRGTVRRSAAVWALKMIWDELRDRGLAALEPASNPTD